MEYDYCHGKHNVKLRFIYVLVWLLLFLVSVNWKSLESTLRQYKEECSKMILPDSPEYNQIIGEIFELKQSFGKRAQSELISPKEVVLAQDRIVELYLKIRAVSGNWSSSTASIYESGLESFTKFWDPNVYHRHDKPRFEFQYQVQYWRSVIKKDGYIEIDLTDLLIFFLWIVFWYYWASFPILICGLIKIGYQGYQSEKFSPRPILEKLGFDWKNILAWSLGGPLGIIYALDTTEKVKRFWDVREEFMRQKGYSFANQITQEDERVIWAKVMKPIIDFEEALILVRNRMVYRPILAFSAVWFLSCLNSVSIHRQITSFIVRADITDGLEFSLNSDEESLLFDGFTYVTLVPVPFFLSKEKTAFSPFLDFFLSAGLATDPKLVRGPPPQGTVRGDQNFLLLAVQNTA